MDTLLQGYKIDFDCRNTNGEFIINEVGGTLTISSAISLKILKVKQESDNQFTFRENDKTEYTKMGVYDFEMFYKTVVRILR